MSNNFISEAEAVRLSITELRDLHLALATALAESEHGSPESIQIAASLRAVMHELIRRNRRSHLHRL